jgi:hypothetical protein
MSENTDKPFEFNMSFEDAMKKAATTKVDPAITFDGKGLEHPIYMRGHSGIQFIQLAINGQHVNRFYVHVRFQSGDLPVETASFHPKVDPNQKQTDTAYFTFPDSVLGIGPDEQALVSILPRPGFEKEDFEYAYLSYKLLP